MTPSRLSWMVAGLFALAAFAAGPASAPAAELVYPTGSPIGLVPPEGMRPSARFMGFEDPDNGAGIVFLALPPEAYATMEKSTTADSFKEPGLTIEKREEFALPIGKAILLTAKQEQSGVTLRKWLLLGELATLTALVVVQMPETAAGIYPDATVRAALATIAVRASVPDDEQLSLVPFTVADRADFRIGGTVPGRALILTDAPAAPAGSSDSTPRIHPHMVIAAVPGPRVEADDRDRLARDLVAAIPNLRELKVRSAEPLRIRGQQGYQVLLDAKQAQSNADITVVQWLRFGAGGFVQMIGVSPKQDWEAAYPRFRAVRDSVEPR